MNSIREANGPGGVGDTVCHSKATYDDSDSRQDGQGNKADELAVASTDTHIITHHHARWRFNWEA